MLSLSIKQKLIALAVVPVALLTLILGILVSRDLHGLAGAQADSVKGEVTELKKQELKSYMTIVWSAIKPIYDSGGSREDAVEVLKPILYGQNGYIFGYDDQALRVFSGSSDAKIGESFWDYQDVNGKYLIRDLITAGKSNQQGSGNEFVTYYFPKPGEKEASPKLSYSIYLPAWNMMIGTGFYIDGVDKLVAKKLAQDRASYGSVIWSLAIVGGVLVLVLIVVGVTIARSISHPIDEVNGSMARLAAGGADLSERLQTGDRHEMGRLVESVNKVLNTLSKLVADIRGVAHEVREETQALENRAEAIEQVSSQQQMQTQEVTGNMDELAASGAQVAENAGQALRAAESASDNCGKAMQEISGSVGAVKELVAEIHRTSEVITHLGDDVENISSILQVIESIAEQTNLLALNAAIEAARAGEQGRGFAVVADEVRSLASKTQQSTEEIQDMIGKLQSGSRSAVSSMESSINKSDVVEKRVQQTNDALQLISNAVAEIQTMNEQISTGAEHQQRLNQAVNTRIQELNSHIATLSQVAAENGKACEGLADKTQSLENVVGQFRL